MYLAKYLLYLMRKSQRRAKRTTPQPGHTHPCPIQATQSIQMVPGASLGASLGLGTAISGPVVHSVYLRRLGGTFEVPYADLLGL